MATSLAKVLEEQQNGAGKVRSTARVRILPNLLWHLCLLHAKPDQYRLIARCLGATIPTERTKMLVKRQGQHISLDKALKGSELQFLGQL